MKNFKTAFTLLELVFVIVIVGILAAIIIPGHRANPTFEARTKLINDIRYTQHLANVDDKFDQNNDDWYKNRWQIVFIGNKYSIVSAQQYAKNPINNDTYFKDIDLNDLYSVSISFSGGCPSGDNSISFDSMGRPMIGNLNNLTSAYQSTAEAAKLLETPCVITLSNPTEESASLSIYQETGYVGEI